ncbi:hypothetical protein [Streptacidiphilus sp. EB129]|uniref:hypothetical protein n=1 Tax=Streptacidiphilus sp. EB129 TaxID=3156262 RepID=UPI00351722B5
MSDAVINGLVAGGLTVVGAVVGWLLSLLAQRRADRRAERARLLTQMQELVMAIMQLEVARKALQFRWLSPKARLRVLSVAAVEFWSAWRSGETTWQSIGAAYAPSIRVVDTWLHRADDAAVELLGPMARVAATGLTLGMCADPAIAAAAQALTDASIEDKGQEAIDKAVRALRAAFYPNEKPTGNG